MSRIQNVISYAAKVIFGRKEYDHVSELLRRLGWLSAKDLATYHTLSLVHKVRRHGEPEGLAAGLTTVAAIRERTTRQDHLCVCPDLVRRWENGAFAAVDKLYFVRPVAPLVERWAPVVAARVRVTSALDVCSRLV